MHDSCAKAKVIVAAARWVTFPLHLLPTQSRYDDCIFAPNEAPREVVARIWLSDRMAAIPKDRFSWLSQAQHSAFTRRADSSKAFCRNRLLRKRRS
jgi:hypothetical protein